MRPYSGLVKSRFVTTGVILAVFLALVSVAVKVGASRGSAGVAYNRQNLIRLHIIANSDSATDQALKLAVRDEIIKRTSQMFRGAKSARSARDIVRENLRLIEMIGQAKVYAAGFDYPVRVQLGRYDFPAKTYGSLMLPPGKYQAVRVVIGEGKGKNWWCVLFPPLCFLKMDTPLANGRVNVTRAPGSAPAPGIADYAKLAELGGLSGLPALSGQVQVRLVAPSASELAVLFGFPMTTPTRAAALFDSLSR